MLHDSLPLCIDLDGTLIRNDTTWLATQKYLSQNPFRLISIVFWLLRGRAFYKNQLAKRVLLDPAKLPYHKQLMEYLEAEKQKRRHIYLVTATDYQFARIIADHLDLFTDVYASDGKTNLRAAAKARWLVHKFGKKGFIYAGNSVDDLKVWQYSAEAIVCSQNNRLISAVNKLGIKVYLMN